MTDKSETVTISRETFDVLTATYAAVGVLRQANNLVFGQVRILTEEQEEELRK